MKEKDFDDKRLATKFCKAHNGELINVYYVGGSHWKVYYG